MAKLEKPSNLTKYLWASGGEAVEPTDDKKLKGWIAEIPPFQFENWLRNRNERAIAHIVQAGIPDWDDSTQYQANKSYVQDEDGTIHRATQTHTGVNPKFDEGENWTQPFDFNNLLDAKANQATTYTETEVNNLLNAKADQATTYTKLETVAEFNQYGLGAVSFSGEPNIDLILTAGTYISVLSGHVNFPPGDNNRAIITIGGSSSDYIKQEIQQVRSPYRRFYRASPTAEIGAQAWIEIAQLSEVNNLLDDKAAISGQAFSGNISAPNLSGTNTGDQDLSGKADKATTYTETEVNNLLDAKANQATTYTETEVDGLLDDTSSLRSANMTVTVGTGGDYPTINAALEYLSKLQPVYASAGITATINLLTGFTMAEQVLVRGLDLGWITITAADAETTITNTALTTDFTTADYGFDSYPVFGVSKGGVLPRIDQLFRFDVANTYSNKHGIMAIGAGSSADVMAGEGVNDAGERGIYAIRGSTINANAADASGAGTYGIVASRGSTINADAADASGAGSHGILANEGSNINADGVYASGAGSHGIHANEGSNINADGADVSGAGDNGIHASSGSTINAERVDASGVVSHGIVASRGSIVNAYSADASGAGSHGILAIRCSTINAYAADASSAGTYGINVHRGSTINAEEATGALSQARNTVTGNGIIFK